MTFLALLLLVQSPKPVEAKPAPHISSEQRAQFWRTVGEINALQAQISQKLTELSEKKAAMNLTCGASYVINAVGEPDCPTAAPAK